MAEKSLACFIYLQSCLSLDIELSQSFIHRLLSQYQPTKLQGCLTTAMRHERLPPPDAFASSKSTMSNASSLMQMVYFVNRIHQPRLFPICDMQ